MLFIMKYLTIYKFILSYLLHMLPINLIIIILIMVVHCTGALLVYIYRHTPYKLEFIPIPQVSLVHCVSRMNKKKKKKSSLKSHKSPPSFYSWRKKLHINIHQIGNWRLIRSHSLELRCGFIIIIPNSRIGYKNHQWTSNLMKPITPNYLSKIIPPLRHLLWS